MNTNDILAIAVLGTGLMGAPIARNLQKKGFAVRAWNRTADKANALAETGVLVFENPQEAVRGADVIVTMLKDADAIGAVMEASVAALKEGVVWLQLSTVGVKGIEALAAWAERNNVVFYDAPVQGTRQPAELAQLVILASGPQSRRDVAQRVFDAIGRRTVWVKDEAGAGSRLKLALNSWAFALTHGLAESLALARGLAIDPALVVDVVTGGPMDSGYFQAKSAAMLRGDYTVSFSIANAVKDAALIVDAAAAADVRMDAALAGLHRFERALHGGHGDEDMAASYLA